MHKQLPKCANSGVEFYPQVFVASLNWFKCGARVSHSYLECAKNSVQCRTGYLLLSTIILGVNEEDCNFIPALQFSFSKKLTNDSDNGLESYGDFKFELTNQFASSWQICLILFSKSPLCQIISVWIDMCYIPVKHDLLH